uniref:AlNc14C6G801 protein n=1 Tax=Albugo laibachii Nc14 TaxID=890382 RepID=F0W122_9STRA|nr:AlNc14C6G801 [Albugo laibachii Nc14]|eukprot:CCA14746.1 AlNc14C6G801 [Albugo laibachii Nc14]
MVRNIFKQFPSEPKIFRGATSPPETNGAGAHDKGIHHGGEIHVKKEANVHVAHDGVVEEMVLSEKEANEIRRMREEAEGNKGKESVEEEARASRTIKTYINRGNGNLEVFFISKEEEDKIDKARHDKDKEIFEEDTEASEAIVALLRGSKPIKILIIAPCSDLAQAIKKVGEDRLHHIEEIVWEGGIYTDNSPLQVAYSWMRDIQATKTLLRSNSLQKKIKIVTSVESNTYNPGMKLEDFRALFETLTISSMYL